MKRGQETETVQYYLFSKFNQLKVIIFCSVSDFSLKKLQIYRIVKNYIILTNFLKFFISAIATRKTDSQLNLIFLSLNVYTSLREQALIDYWEIFVTSFGKKENHLTFHFNFVTVREISSWVTHFKYIWRKKVKF